MTWHAAVRGSTVWGVGDSAECATNEARRWLGEAADGDELAAQVASLTLHPLTDAQRRRCEVDGVFAWPIVA